MTAETQPTTEAHAGPDTPDAPVFIVGTERSGSNLLRLILNAHPEITVPHPPHILAYFAGLESRYGDLSQPRNFACLTDDVVTHVERHIHPWPTPIDKAKLMAEAAPRDVFGLYARIHEQHLAAIGKRRWGCKSTFMIHHTDRILDRYPDARLIWIVRDPRDVALSSRDSVFNPFHPYYTARLWATQQELGLRLAATLPGANLLKVHYEDLIRAPSETVERICAFVGVRFDPTMLRYFDTADARTSASLARDWRNTASAILSDNAGKFRAGLSSADIAAVESVAATPMRELGYQPITPPRALRPAGLVRRSYYRVSDEIMRLRVEYLSLREDHNTRRRWARRARIATLTTRLKFGIR